MIILKRKFVDVELPSGVGISGEYKLVVSDAHGNVKRETDWFPNIILDQGLNRLGTDAGIAGAAIGTGTTVPAANQTGLVTQSAWTTTTATGGSSTNAGASPYWAGSTYVYRFTIGTLNGNYSEIGVGWATGANMFSRALILDSGGSPTTITVGATEQLDVYYTRRIYPPLSDVVTTPTISGVSTTVTTRASNVNSSNHWSAGLFPSDTSNAGGVKFGYSGAIGAITAGPSGTTDSQYSSVLVAYSNNSYARTMNITFGTDRGNYGGGMGSIFVPWYMAAFQHGFSPAIAKDNTKTLALVVSLSWARRP